MNTAAEKNSYYAYLLFLVWPFLALISALKNYRMPWAKNIFWVFCMFYGLMFVVDYDSSRDIVRTIADFQRIYGLDITLSEFLSSSERADFFRLIIDYTLSRFTDNPAILTLVYAAVFGFFLSRNIWYILERLQGQLMPVTIFLLVCFFLLNPIWNINGFRMWTAAQIFLYGLLPFLCEGKKKGLIFSIGSIFVHFSFLVPVLVLLIYTIAGNRLTAYYIFYIVAFFISEIDIVAFNMFIETYAPEIIQDRTRGYRGEASVVQYREEISDNVWYARWYQPALNLVIMGFLSLFYFTGRNFFKENQNWMNLFCFALLFYGVAYLFSSLPSGARFLVVGNMTALALIILYIQNRPKEKLMKWYIWISSPALLLFFAVAVRLGLDSISVTSVIGNLFIAFFSTGIDFSLWELIRMIR